MKKLLLALTILAGSVLPGMAQDYSKNAMSLAVERASWDYLLMDNTVSDRVVFLKSLLNDENIIESDWKVVGDSTIETVLERSVEYNNISFIQFLIDNGMPLSEYGRYIKFARKMWQEIQEEWERELHDYPDHFFVKKYDTTEAILSLLLTKAIMKTSQDFNTESKEILKNILKDIDESDWKLINKNSVVNTSVPLIEFLISLGMPKSEFDEYHNAAKHEMDRYESLGSVQGYERCRSIFDFFEEMKQEEMLRKAAEVHENIGETLRKITEEKMQQLDN